MQKECPRCKRTFECTPETIASCQCSTVQLRATTLAYLAEHYSDCLCKDCLQGLEKEESAEQAFEGD